MTEKITCFLPCRAGSQRILKKNIKTFANYQYGLIQIKLDQLLESESIEEIVLSTNDNMILEYAESLGDTRIRLHQRAEELSSSETSTDQLVAHALELIPSGHILWTHVTSPFISAKYYDEIIKAYFQKIKVGYDSLMTATPIHGFLWQDEEPMNYDRASEKWPRTQTLRPVYEINSGAFIASTEIYSELDDRIGRRPYIYELDKIISFDIDWPEDFVIAECLAEKGLARL